MDMHVALPPDLALSPHSRPGAILPYPHERTLRRLLRAVAFAYWLILTVLTAGLVWLAVGALMLWRLLRASRLVAKLQGNGVRIEARQFPEIHACLLHCCRATGVRIPPEAYLVHGAGQGAAHTLRFRGRDYLALDAATVAALQGQDDALAFHIGHALGQLAQRPTWRHGWLQLAMLTPLLGPACARAQQYSCDQFGLACCASPTGAVAALAVLALGPRGAARLDPAVLAGQAARSGGFWMAFNELAGDQPWLCKRIARLREGALAHFPRRHRLAWLAAALVPRTGMGWRGSAALYLGALLLAASTAVPLYQRYVERIDAARLGAALERAYDSGEQAARRVQRYAEREQHLPVSLRQAGVAQPGGARIELADEGGMLTVRLGPPFEWAELYLIPSVLDGKIEWICSANDAVATALLPPPCQPQAPAADAASPDDAAPAPRTRSNQA